MTRHHVIPISRRGTSNNYNIALVPEKDHMKYHALFANRTPQEIIAYLVDDFWNGQWHHVEQAMKNHRKHIPRPTQNTA